jgi:hypothetical protein
MDRRSDTADPPICAVAERRLVDDAVANLWLDALLITPVLRKDVVDIDIFIEENRLVGVAFREEVFERGAGPCVGPRARGCNDL